MGFPWGSKAADGAAAASTKQPKTDQAAKAAADAKPAGFSIKPSAEAVRPEADQATNPASSVFEFGPTVSIGQNYMRGVCTGDDPDTIQACAWQIEPVQGKPREKHHLYRIEF